MDITTMEPGTAAQFVTVSRDELNALKNELFNLREDHAWMGETLEASKECVNELDAALKLADASTDQLRTDLATANQSLAIERRNVQLLADQLRVARDENSDLHAELSKAGQAVAPYWSGGFDSEKQTQPARDGLTQAAYPDAELAREAGVSETAGEGDE